MNVLMGCGTEKDTLSTYPGPDRQAGFPMVRRIAPEVTGLAFRRKILSFGAMWNQPYLETCCRAALHRLHLCGQAGRPAGMLDEPCLNRLNGLGLCDRRPDKRFTMTPEGARRHANEILKQPAPATIMTEVR